MSLLTKAFKKSDLAPPKKSKFSGSNKEVPGPTQSLHGPNPGNFGSTRGERGMHQQTGYAHSSGRGKFTRMHSFTSLQNQTIPEESIQDTGFPTRHNYMTKSFSFPSKFDLPVAPRSSRLTRSLTFDDDPGISFNTDLQPRSTSRFAIPTIVLFGFLTMVLCSLSYLVNHTLSFRGILPDVSSHQADTEVMQDFSLMEILHLLQGAVMKALTIFNSQYWILAPLCLGIAVSTVTWSALHYNQEKEADRPRPSLQFGKVVSVLNGLLLGLYYLLYTTNI